MQSSPSTAIPPVTARDDAALTIYYDGACPVCSREIATYRRQAGAHRCVWIDASSCAESALAPGLPRERALCRVHVRRQDAVLVDGMKGFALRWRASPRLARAGRIASTGPFPLLFESAYRLFLRIRVLRRGARGSGNSEAAMTSRGLRNW